MEVKTADLATADRVAETVAKINDFQPRRKPGRLIKLALAVAVLAAGGFYAYPWLVSRWTHVVLDDARVAAIMVTISSEVSGRVTSLPVIAGDRVARGQVLAEIDAASVEQEIKALDAQVAGVLSQQEQMRAQQAFIRAQVASKLQASQAQIEMAEASHDAAKAALGNARSQFDRVNTLAGQKVLSAQQLEEADARASVAVQEERATAAGIRTAIANLEVVKSEEAQIGVIDQQIAVLEAQLDSLEAQSEQKRLDLAKRQIRAEFDGVVDSTFVDSGEYLSPGTRLLIYHDPNSVWVDANVKETDFRKLALGASSKITVDAYPDREFKGEVFRTGEAATSQFALLPSPNPSGNFTKVTQRLPIRISIDQSDGLLRPGMMVEASIDVR